MTFFILIPLGLLVAFFAQAAGVLFMMGAAFLVIYILAQIAQGAGHPQIFWAGFLAAPFVIAKAHAEYIEWRVRRFVQFARTRLVLQQDPTGWKLYDRRDPTRLLCSGSVPYDKIWFCKQLPNSPEARQLMEPPATLGQRHPSDRKGQRDRGDLCSSPAGGLGNLHGKAPCGRAALLRAGAAVPEAGRGEVPKAAEDRLMTLKYRLLALPLALCGCVVPPGFYGVGFYYPGHTTNYQSYNGSIYPPLSNPYPTPNYYHYGPYSQVPNPNVPPQDYQNYQYAPPNQYPPQDDRELGVPPPAPYTLPAQPNNQSGALYGQGGADNGNNAIDVRPGTPESQGSTGYQGRADDRTPDTSGENQESDDQQ